MDTITELNALINRLDENLTRQQKAVRELRKHVKLAEMLGYVPKGHITTRVKGDMRNFNLCLVVEENEQTHMFPLYEVPVILWPEGCIRDYLQLDHVYRKKWDSLMKEAGVR